MRVKYRARPAPAPPPPPSRRRRWVRRLIWLAVFLGYAAVLWYYVFPYVDRTFVNQPAV